MPTLIEMRLKAAWTVQPDMRKVHWLACVLFENPAAEHTGQEKPFAVSPFWTVPDGSPDEWMWRAAWLPDSPAPSRVPAADSLPIAHADCSVLESSRRRVTRAALASGPPTGSVTVSFESPVFFSHNGAHVVVPEPRLIAGSWRRRWNASLPHGDPLAISDDEWKDTHQLLGLAGFDLSTTSRDSGHGREQAGFTGTVMLQLARNAPYAARKILGTLARFAEFCGTGAQTTHGFGVTTLAGRQ